MSKFDTIIATKLNQLNEVAAPQVGAAPTAQPGATPTPTAPTVGTTPTPAAPPTTQETPEQTLSKVFQNMKFSDPNTAIKTLNTALQGAGKAPGIKEFFSSLAFDPQKGFIIPQAGTAPQAAAASPNAAPALK